MALDTLSPAGAGPAPGPSDTIRRLRAMRLRLAAHITLGSVRQRNQLVYRAHDAVGGRTTELSPIAAELLLLCDGSHSLADLIEVIRARQPELDQQQATEEAFAVVGAAETGGLLLPVEPKAGGYLTPTPASLFWRTVKNPLFARFSLFNPSRLFTALAPLANALFSPVGLVVWLLVVGAGASLAVANWDDLMAHASDQGLQAHNLLWIVLLFPLVKILHETGHGLACKRWGGEVRDFGISLMVFVPIPYVDCSDSTFFIRRRQRIIVAAAGMLVEFVLASLALMIWLISTDELTRVLAFNLMVLTSVTTVLFNANPLMRYDAYYIVSELLGIDNLSSKSQQLIGGWARRIFFLGQAVPMPARPAFEALVLLGYGIGSFIYRIFLVFAIVVGILPRFFVLGFVLAAWAAGSMVVLPLYKRSIAAFGYMKQASAPARRRAFVGAGLMLGVVLLLALVPVPYAVVADGAIRLPPEAIVRAVEAGVVETLPEGQAGEVLVGAPLLTLANPQLGAELNSNRATLTSLERKHQALLASNLSDAALAEADMQVTEEDVADGEMRMAALAIKSPGAGRFELADGIVPGVYVEEGAAVGVVLSETAQRSATVAVSQEDADLINSRLAAIAVRPVGNDSRVRPATLEREYVVTTQRKQNGKAVGPKESRFAFELGVASAADLPYGQALKVRFDLGWAPLSLQVWRSLHIWYEKLMLSRYINDAG